MLNDEVRHPARRVLAARKQGAARSSRTTSPQIEVQSWRRLDDLRRTCGIAAGSRCPSIHTRARLMLSGKPYRFRPHPDGLAPKYLADPIQRHETQLRSTRLKRVQRQRAQPHARPLCDTTGARSPLSASKSASSRRSRSCSRSSTRRSRASTLARAQLGTYRQALLDAALRRLVCWSGRRVR